MQVVSSAEFATQQEKFFLMAHHQRVLVQSGNYTYRIMPEPTVTEPAIFEPDEDFHNSISMEDVRERLHKVVDKLYAKS